MNSLVICYFLESAFYRKQRLETLIYDLEAKLCSTFSLYSISTGNGQSRAGWGFGQPYLVGGVPNHVRDIGTGWSLRSLSTQTFL